MGRLALIRALRLAILPVLGLLVATAGMLLVMVLGKAMAPLALLLVIAAASYLILRGPALIRGRSGKE